MPSGLIINDLKLMRGPLGTAWVPSREPPTPRGIRGSGGVTALLEAAELLPEVTAVAALEDARWFAEHPQRRFRARRGNGGACLIRRRRRGDDTDVYLRTFSATPAPRGALPSDDADGVLAALWFAAAFSNWPLKKCRKAARQALMPAARAPP